MDRGEGREVESGGPGPSLSACHSGTGLITSNPTVISSIHSSVQQALIAWAGQVRLHAK
jgi:hypothetical protein